MTRPAVVAACAAVVAAVGGVVAWQPEPASRAAAASEAPAGADVFAAKGCATCHTGPDGPALVGGLPSLMGASRWAGERRPGMDAAEYLAESIRTPAAFVSPAFVSGGGPTDAMPDLGLDDAEIAALVEYLLAGSTG